MHTTHRASRLVTVTFAALISVVANAQTRTSFVEMAGNTPAAVWRATSRLGYAPTADDAAAMAPRTWALSQIDSAYAASQQAPAIPPELARINEPLGDIARAFQAEREARKTLRTQPMPNAGEPLPTSPVSSRGTDAKMFSREMAQSAAAWRVMACSDPALENPLLARMTEFWFNHLNVFVGKGNVRPFVGHYVVNAIRANALGRFENLLLASAKHPAMLYYLDQAQSNSRGLNENYARELMELHTLGVGGGYTQNDVHELARILTGWIVNLRNGEGFRFAKQLHDKGDKTFLGQRVTNQGEKEGEDAIRFLARQPATAHRVSERLATFFVSDKPPAALVQRLSQTFLATQGDMRVVMRTLVTSPEFWAADNPLFKTPMDFACSALTVGGGVKVPRDVTQTLGFLAQAGQPMHGWPTPDGYKTAAATWLAPEALTRRADFAMGLASRISDAAYLDGFLSPATQERIAREPPRMRVGLMLASPDFMRK